MPRANCMRRASDLGLCVLDYMVTSNHVHLLVRDTAEGVIARSIQFDCRACRAGLQPPKSTSRGVLGGPLSRHRHRVRSAFTSLRRVH
jgi:hypothetical protein